MRRHADPIEEKHIYTSGQAILVLSHGEAI
jgi:hypothetical protein